jgi:hypothetical protein
MRTAQEGLEMTVDARPPRKCKLLVKAELMAKMAEGKSSGSRKVRDARDYDKEAEENIRRLTCGMLSSL